MKHKTAKARVEADCTSLRVDADLLQEMWLEAFERTGTGTMLVVGDSMRPSILRGERVVVSALSEDEPVRAGDVVLLRIENALVVHRILRRLGRSKPRFRQKGDATLVSSVVGADAVLAKVIGVQQDGGIRPLDNGRWMTGGLLLWATVSITDLLYRSGRLIGQPLRPLAGSRRAARVSRSIKSFIRVAQERFVEELTSKVRPT